MTGIRHAGEYELVDLKLLASSGEVINLNLNYTLIDIYENMFSNGLTGTITVADTNNLIMNAPIIGQEFLAFKIKTPSLDNVPIDFTQHVMAVYKIDSRVSDMGGEVFILHFCSPEILRNSRVRLSKSYDGNISDTVNRILKDKKSVNTKKDLFIESTLGNKKIVSPNKNPYSLIRDLTIDAISDNGSPNFIFFENLDGIHFRTLDSLYDKDSVGDYVASDRGSVDFQKGGVSNLEEDFKRVLDYQITGNNDTKRNIKSGMFGSKTISYNIFQKNYSVRQYDYFEEFDSFSRVSGGGESFPIYSKGAVDFANNISDFKDAKIYLHSTSKDTSGLDTQHYVGTKTNYTPNDIEKTIAHRDSKHAELDNGVKINMEINGNTTIKVGSIIDFQIPITGTNHTGDDYDVYYSGRFLVTKARHSFDKLENRYRIYMSIVKDSFNQELPDGGSEAQQPTGGIL
jgi:hypothetical protein